MVTTIYSLQREHTVHPVRERHLSRMLDDRRLTHALCDAVTTISARRPRVDVWLSRRLSAVCSGCVQVPYIERVFAAYWPSLHAS